MTVLSAVLTPAAKVNIERIDMIVRHLIKIKRALLQADSKRETGSKYWFNYSSQPQPKHEWPTG